MEITPLHITMTLIRILKSNAPVRGNPFPPSVKTARQRTNYMKKTKTSPYPGNLKDNGIVCEEMDESHSRVVIGGERAVYAERTEKVSMRPGWMAKSNNELLDKLRQAGGRVR